MREPEPPRPYTSDDGKTLRQLVLQTPMAFFNWTPSDAMAFDAMLATCITTKWARSTESLFTFLIAPPSSGKTEMLRGLQDWTGTIFLTKVTPNALISGYRDPDGNDPSIAKRLQDHPGTTLVCPDLTTQLESKPERTFQLMGELRQIFDGGELTVHSGTDGETTYHIKAGMLCALTNIREIYDEHLTQMGQRFLTVFMAQDRAMWSLRKRMTQTRRAAMVSPRKDKWRELYRHTMAAFLDQFVGQFLEKEGADLEDFSPGPLREKMSMLATLLACFRSSPLGGKPQIPEGPDRITQQYAHLGAAHCMLSSRQHWDEDQITFLRRITVDSLPPTHLAMMRVLNDQPDGATPLQLAHAASCDTQVAAAICQQWEFASLIVRAPARPSHYVFSPEAYEFLGDTALLRGPYALPLGKEYPSLFDGDDDHPEYLPEEFR